MTKTRFPTIFGILVVVVLVASFAAPVGLASPSPAGADPGICKWATLEMPGSVVGKNDILHGSEVNRIAVGNDGVTIIAAVTRAATIATPYVLYLYTTATGGIVWEDRAYGHLRAEMTAAGVPAADQNVWDVAIAPDDVDFWAVVTSVAGANQPAEVWVTENAGGKWECTRLAGVTGNAVIGAIDISPSYGRKRDIAVGTVTGLGAGTLYVWEVSGFAGWVNQTVAPSTGWPGGNVVALKFSPTYAGDSSLATLTASISLLGVWGSAWNDVFAVGTGGTILHYNGAVWNTMASGTTDHLVGVWGSAWNDVFAVGTGGTILHYNGVAWGAMVSGTTSHLVGVWGSAWNDVFAVGQGGTILHYNGVAWGAMVSGTTNHLVGVWGSAWNDVFAVGQGGTILHYNGVAWGAMASGTTNGLWDVWGSAPNDVFAVGAGGIILHYNGVAWSTMASGATAPAGTFLNLGIRDVFANQTTWNSPVNYPVLIAAASYSGGSFPAGQFIVADLELPSDFSGAAPNLRRYYVSIDAPAAQSGVYHIDDTQVHSIRPFLASRVSSIAYFGTVASGKLLVGEVLGSACAATVPTWFTDSAASCGGACWYPALKPATGAAGVCACTDNTTGFGNAQVAWNADGSLAYCATGASQRGFGPGWWGSDPDGVPGSGDEAGFLAAPIPDDESAFSISRNDAETWNQLGLIDTTIDWFNDVAPAADCNTLYLASASDNLTCNPGCNNFDSVWRTSASPAVVSPLPPAYPLGSYYERVLCRVNAVDCEAIQSELPLLRLAPDRDDGEVLFWGAQNTRAAAWSPDFGDYWANINPRNVIQDFVAESSTVVYFLDPSGLVQAMPYTGIAWSSFKPDVDTGVSTAHMITAQSAGKVLVGADANYNAAAYPAAISINGGADFNLLMDRLPTSGNVHVAFDPDFDDNNQYFVADDAAAGTVYRMTFLPGFGCAERWEDTNMMSVVNGAIGCNAPHPIGQFGLQLATTGADDQHALYSAHAAAGAVAAGAAVAEQVLMTVTAAPAAGLVNAEVVTLTTNLVAATVMPALPILAPVGSFVVSPVATITTVTAAVAAPSTATGAVSLTGVTTGANYGTLDLFTNTFVAGPGQVPAAAVIANAGVCRTLWPLDGMPKPGIVWDCLDVYVSAPAAGVNFTLEPWSLKKCGCLTMDTDTILWAIDAEVGGVFNGALGYNPAANQGMVWGFSDCMAKVGPTLITEDGMLVGCDPVSGRNQEVNFCWEQLCVADEYDIEIAKNEDFSIRVIDWVGDGNTTGAACVGFLRPVDIMTPCVFFPAGGASAPYVHASEIAQWGNLECGHTYYWRVQVRQCATGQQIRSPWSEVRSFTIKAGLPVRADYYGIKLLAPDNGCLGCAVSPASFSWAPFKGTTSYKFVLAKDAALADVIAEGEVGTTAYEYDGTLDYSTNYFWRVMSLEPAPSDWSATFSFQTEAAPAPPPAPQAPPSTPLWVWVVIAIGLALGIATLILILRTRRE